MTSFFNLYSSKEVKTFDFWSYGFQNFKRAWGIFLRIALELLLPIIILVLAFFIRGVGIIICIISFIWIITKSYYYTKSYFIAIDNPEMSTKEAVEKSREIMTNNRAKLFFLELSFIGWMILAGFTLGIGFLWLAPYMMFAEIAFYHFVAKKDENVVFEETPENPTETLE